ncbi:MAG: hypothetical protein II919_03870 [Lachnospiraceae bacterium]|nr:hypothetical protein [Lachnospiraceae bacterium]
MKKRGDEKNERKSKEKGMGEAHPWHPALCDVMYPQCTFHHCYTGDGSCGWSLLSGVSGIQGLQLLHPLRRLVQTVASASRMVRIIVLFVTPVPTVQKSVISVDFVPIAVRMQVFTVRNAMPAMRM